MCGEMGGEGKVPSPQLSSRFENFASCVFRLRAEFPLYPK
jgi:hypothetical protein